MFAPVCDETAPAAPRRYDPDLDLLRDPRDPGRFVCVYAVGRDRWRARVMKRINIHTYDTQLNAAKGVLAFYKQVFGASWYTAFKRRKVNPWRIRRLRKDGFTAYVADVYVEGSPVRVTLADTKRFTGAALAFDRRIKVQRANRSRAWWPETEVYFFPTREAARAAVRGFIYHQLGILANFRMWRG